ncbi:hypothetical protein UXO81_23565 [Enterobacter hormaechei]|uniref:hypothetical protein n=1 Tax=Enterobacter hormaechei TaxID=158836 RepID=UPI0023AEF0FB|nr:hypothetical protein [Enterobacter hormaechei]MDE7629154.1 hypothetical protein [Enterobacter hormaechei]
MSTITKEQAQSVSDLKAGYTLGHADVAILNELARIALASLEAEPAIHRWRRVTVEPYGPYPWHYGNFIGFSKPVEGIEDEYFYSAPSAPVVPQEATPEDIAILASTFAPRGVTYQWDSDECNAAADSWNACRAAMLQGAEPVTTVNKLPFEQWLSQQTGTIDVECGCVMTEVFFHWLRVAYEAGNSPVTPDGWVLVPEEPTHEMLEAGDEQFGTYDVYRRMIAASPQQK